VTGDCKVEKKAAMSGRDSTLSRRSGRRKRSIMTMAMANRRPMRVRMSRARRAGNTLTRVSVTTEPAATGIVTNGISVSTAVR
jgi:hypothetical protein